MIKTKYLGPTIKKGSFIARNTKVGDYLIRKDAIEEINKCIAEFMFPIALARTYDPNDLVRHALKQIKNYSLLIRKTNWEEDCIMNYLDTEVYRVRTCR